MKMSFIRLVPSHSSFLILLFLFLFPLLGWAQTIVGGIIYTNTTWTLAGSPYILQSQNIIVDPGITLTIDPGVNVKFAATRSIQIDGTLRAIGTASQPITFTSNATNPQPGDWGYILINNSSSPYNFSSEAGCILQHCIIEYAGGVTVNNNGALRLDNARPYIDSTIFRFNKMQAIRVFNLAHKLYINGCAVQNNTADTGIIYCGGIDTGRVFIENTTISYNTSSLGINNVYYSAGIVSVLLSVSIKNCTITNNDGSGIWGNKISAVDTISNCIIANNREGLSFPWYYVNSNGFSAVVTGNEISNNARNGIYFDYSYFDCLTCSFNISGNSIIGNGQNGIKFNGGPIHSDSIKIYNNTVKSNGIDGISFSVTNYGNTILLIDNTVSDNLQNGILITSSGSSYGGNSYFFSGNNIEKNIKNGLSFAGNLGSNKYYFSGNKFNYNSEDGILLTGKSWKGNFEIDQNFICGNNGSGIHWNSNTTGNLYAKDTINISRNFILNNISGGGIKIIRSQVLQADLNVFQNIISKNSSTGEGGGLFLNLGNGNTTIMENTIINNYAPNSSAIYYQGPNSITINKNTVVGNLNTGPAPARAVYILTTTVAPDHQFRYNNVFNSSANAPHYELWFAGANNDSLNARNCYWQKNSLSEVYDVIYDYIDSSILGRVYPSPFEATPVITAPVTPVQNTQRTDLGGGSIKVQWSSNQESDISGYRIYWGNPTGFSFSNFIDVGNDTSYIFDSDSITINDTIAITAYDNNANGVNDQVEGQESWFSESPSTVLPISETKTPENSEINIFPNPGTNSITITSKSGDEIKIFDGRGRIIKRFENFEGDLIFSTDEFDTGIYFLMLFYKHQLLSRKSFVVVK